ncbi:MAG TPA: glycerophosphodiester phosphodiesterase [Solirubrobacteraceae bacterium]
MLRSRLRARTLLAGALSLLLIAGALAGPSFAHRDKSSTGGHHPGPSGHRVIIIGHRGAAGYRPEHTLASYELAARMGADYVEPDLVSTKDHVLVARHEPNITDTTDVADHPEFAGRKTTKTIDGTTQTGWFTDDFTLAELKTLRAKERLPLVRQRNTLYDGRYEIPTFQEVIDLVKRLSRELHRDIGIYPETKHPTYFRDEGLPIEEPLVQTLNRNGLNRRGAKVFVQSFEISNLKALDKVLRVPLVQLLDSPALRPPDVVKAGGTTTYGDLATAAGLTGIARYADGVGPSKDYIIPRDAAGHSLPPTSFVADAHAAGLVVHPYTFRNENQFLPAELRKGDPADPNFPNLYGDAFAEDEMFFKVGVDGIFTDNADTGVAARNESGF